MKIEKTQATQFKVYLPCNRKVKVMAFKECWEIEDTYYGSLGHITLSETEINELIEAIELIKKTRDSI